MPRCRGLRPRTSRWWKLPSRKPGVRPRPCSLPSCPRANTCGGGQQAGTTRLAARPCGQLNQGGKPGRARTLDPSLTSHPATPAAAPATRHRSAAPCLPPLQQQRWERPPQRAPQRLKRRWQSGRPRRHPQPAGTPGWWRPHTLGPSAGLQAVGETGQRGRLAAARMAGASRVQLWSLLLNCFGPGTALAGCHGLAVLTLDFEAAHAGLDQLRHQLHRRQVLQAARQRGTAPLFLAQLPRLCSFNALQGSTAMNADCSGSRPSWAGGGVRQAGPHLRRQQVLHIPQLPDDAIHNQAVGQAARLRGRGWVERGWGAIDGGPARRHSRDPRAPLPRRCPRGAVQGGCASLPRSPVVCPRCPTCAHCPRLALRPPQASLL